MWNGGRYTPLHWNCREGDLEMCKWLVANGAADDARKVAAYDGYTPMLTACQFDQLTICRWLFEAAGAAEDIRSAGEENGDTPMLVACGYGHLEVCEWLLGVGAAADVVGFLKDGDPVPHLPELVGGREAGEAGADDGLASIG